MEVDAGKTFNGRRVLVVDDSTTFLVFVESLLKKAGAVVSTVVTGEEGLVALNRERFDLVLLDLMLPGIGGMDVLVQLRQSDRRTPVVILTGAGDVRSAIEAVHAGADGYSEKKDLLTGGDPTVFFHAVDQAIQYRSNLVAREELQERLEHVSFHDALTDLYNRAFFEEEIVRLEKSRRFPVTILVVDVNWLKTANDRLGHLAGDELLRRTAVVLREVFRPEDLIARIGGDEFVVLLPDTSPSASFRILSRIDGRVEENNVKHHSAPLSLALGMATAERPGSLLEAFRRADAAMYANKERVKKEGCPWFDAIPVHPTAEEIP